MTTKQLTSTITLGSNIHIIVITGGPCGGKSTGLIKLRELLEERGYKVLVSPEAASKYINAGVYPWDDLVTFQELVLEETMMQEELLIEAAKAYRARGFKVIILCDRGAMDGRAYVTEGVFQNICTSNRVTYNSICNLRYHAVMHLRTAALGAEKYYTLENNAARKETPEEARALDQRTLEAWQGHHHLRVIDNSTGMEGKINRLLAEVCTVIGDPLPIEREEKYLIEPIEVEAIPARVEVCKIVQDYLLPANKNCHSVACKSCPTFCPNTLAPEPVHRDGDHPHQSEGERRIRARIGENGTSYFYTIKYQKAPGERIEVERMISLVEYQKLLNAKDPEFRTIRKTRLCFFYESQPIEIDLYDDIRVIGDSPLAIMEIEMNQLQQTPKLPPFVKVLQRVTNDAAYSNRGLAHIA